MLLPFLRRCGRFLRCERAVSALEYAVLAGVVIAGVGTAIVAFTDNIETSIANVGTKLEKSTEKLDLQQDTLKTQ